MSENQENENFELDDDFSEPWDDFLDDEPLDDFSVVENFSDSDDIPAPKKVSLRPVFIFAILIAGISGGAYMLSPNLLEFTKKTTSNIPIVKIEPSVTDIGSSETIKEQIDDLIAADIGVSQDTVVSDDENIALPSADDVVEVGTVDSTTESVLTPLPDVSSMDASALPDLSAAVSETVVVQEQSFQHISEESSPLTEEEFLSKTNLPFDGQDVPLSGTDSVISEHQHKPINSEVNVTKQVLPKKNDTDLGKTVAEDGLVASDTPDVKDVANTEQSKTVTEKEAPKVKKSAPSQTATRDVKTEKPQIVHPKAPQPLWTIKGAQPNRAIIYDKRTQTTQTVEIGDYVSGVGRIQSIKKVDGKWQIIGTRGRIQQ